MKSANCISATGRIPSIAAPTAVPTIADSASGVSHTRSGPNSSKKPSVTLNAPPKAPMSSPRQNTVSSLRISSRRPSEIAWRYVISGIAGLPARPGGLAVAERRHVLCEDAVKRGGWVGHRLSESPFGLALELLSHLGVDRLHVDSVARERALVRLDRIALRPVLEQLLRHIAHVVVRAVAVHAHRLGLDQRRAAAAPRALARLGRGLEHRLHVVAVDLDAGEAIALHASHGVDSELVVVRRRVGELVVLEHE